ALSSQSAEAVRVCDYGSASDKTWVGKTMRRNGTMRCDAEIFISHNTTPAYRAPEMADLYSGQDISCKTDVWALGVLLYKMMYFKAPFADTDIPLGIIQNKWHFPVPVSNLRDTELRHKKEECRGKGLSVDERAAAPREGLCYSESLKACVRMCLTKKVDERATVFDVARYITKTAGVPCPLPTSLRLRGTPQVTEPGAIEVSGGDEPAPAQGGFDAFWAEDNATPHAPAQDMFSQAVSPQVSAPAPAADDAFGLFESFESAPVASTASASNPPSADGSFDWGAFSTAPTQAVVSAPPSSMANQAKTTDAMDIFSARPAPKQTVQQATVQPKQSHGIGSLFHSKQAPAYQGLTSPVAAPTQTQTFATPAKGHKAPAQAAERHPSHMADTLLKKLLRHSVPKWKHIQGLAYLTWPPNSPSAGLVTVLTCAAKQSPVRQKPEARVACLASVLRLLQLVPTAAVQGPSDPVAKFLASLPRLPPSPLSGVIDAYTAYLRARVTTLRGNTSLHANLCIRDVISRPPLCRRADQALLSLGTSLVSLCDAVSAIGAGSLLSTAQGEGDDTMAVRTSAGIPVLRECKDILGAIRAVHDKVSRLGSPSAGLAGKSTDPFADLLSSPGVSLAPTVDEAHIVYTGLKGYMQGASNSMDREEVSVVGVPRMGETLMQCSQTALPVPTPLVPPPVPTDMGAEAEGQSAHTAPVQQQQPRVVQAALLDF
ncbi:hypothetical protein KIPB_002135, partial [Kipferlia bialata]